MVLPLLFGASPNLAFCILSLVTGAIKSCAAIGASFFSVQRWGGDQRRWRKGNLYGSKSDLIGTQGKRRVESHSREGANVNPVHSGLHWLLRQSQELIGSTPQEAISAVDVFEVLDRFTLLCCSSRSVNSNKLALSSSSTNYRL